MADANLQLTSKAEAVIKGEREMKPSNPRVRLGTVAAIVGVLLLGSALVLSRSHQVRWRVAVVRLKSTNSLPDISWTDLLGMMSRRGNAFHLDKLVETPNPYLAIDDPFSSSDDVAAGKNLFRDHCADCHGADATGSNNGPSLQHRQFVQGGSDWALFRTVSFGIKGTAMPVSNLPANDKWRLVAFVKSLSPVTEVASTAPSIPATGDHALHSVSYEQILAADKDSDNWLTYSGSYDGHRFSPDNQIKPANAAGLRLLWARQYTTTEMSVETSPIVVNGYMFVTSPPNRVEALNAKTGDIIWAYERQLPQHLSLCCGVVNRGLAVLGDTLFYATVDAHLVALDAKTGSVVWDVEIADNSKGYSITGAPLVLKNMILTGVAGGEYGIRGFLTARDVATGKEIWRFNTIPDAGQPGSETWDGGSDLKTGGGPTWITGSFDPEANLIYWTVGNPSPNFEGDERQGDNLYTNSVVALDADNGTLRWYYQFTPHDLFDWDATEIVVLFDGTVAGKREHLLGQADRNGFYYLLDRATGHLNLAKAFAKVTWSNGFDSTGRPTFRPSAHPTPKGTALYPGVGGATNWYSPSYSPATNLLYVPVLDWGGTYYSGKSEYHPGEEFPGGSFQYFTDAEPQGAVRALDPLTGAVKWEHRASSYEVGGVLSTAGGVVFGSLAQNFFALDARTGQQLWTVTTGGRIVAAPVTFMCDGKQMVTIAAGHDLLTFGF